MVTENMCRKAKATLRQTENVMFVIFCYFDV